MKRIRQIFGHPSIPIISVLLIMFGFFSSYLFKFDISVQNHDILLAEIYSSQQGVESLQNQIEILQMEIEQLKAINSDLVNRVCILQNQLIRIGITPDDPLEDCNES